MENVKFVLYRSDHSNTFSVAQFPFCELIYPASRHIIPVTGDTDSMVPHGECKQELW